MSHNSGSAPGTEPQNLASATAQEPTSPAHGAQRWLRTLSDPELDLLISLKDLAFTHADNAKLSVLADQYDPQILRALGIVLLETLKERLKGTSIDPSIFDRLALSSDSDAHFPSVASDSESEGARSKPEKTPMVVDGKRKQIQPTGWLGEKGKKRRKSVSQDSSEHI
ncbi:uncharacterized protein LOC102703408 [Oryza brachyantha]|uniref:Gamma-tubulin complex component n=1 Tax=Oryza brachyantha TaxID=4533 RepID=J3MHW1_ORYBR|nr:uncharacterized protein LOC102703408 [Oryza brachyantha]